MIRDHALHLYFFCLPDVFGKDSIFDLDESKDALIKQAFAVKSAGNNLSKVIAGRAVHPTFQKIGHFSHIPSKEEIKDMVNQLKNTREYVFGLIDIFYNSNFEFARETNFISLTSNDYSFLEGEILTSGGLKIKEEDFWTYKDSKVIYANFVIPTAQNQIKMENDIRLLLPRILDKSKHEIHHELEKVIRAYDP
ncbi:MAG: hypothetical protein ACXWFC_13225, partial [Nitrososphaeraceae archaeon]